MYIVHIRFACIAMQLMQMCTNRLSRAFVGILKKTAFYQAAQKILFPAL